MLPIMNWKKVGIYLLVINLIGFFTMGIDKYKAQNDKWRIPEKTLFLITFLFGGFGTIAGMKVFHHKTQKWYFKLGFPMILISEIALSIYFIFIWNPNA